MTIVTAEANVSAKITDDTIEMSTGGEGVIVVDSPQIAPLDSDMEHASLTISTDDSKVEVSLSLDELNQLISDLQGTRDYEDSAK